ncbi:MAG: glycosyltransferase [Proteobacteria bacterium]|nr:glycosyltransferase [Pseudomonadota bacterium]MBU4469953.1 glycosyltransferase [Pseudomonadota bacterium]MCG2753715.1 glycosyltransferase [Desulfobacteraceae bacterium]
MAVFKFSLVTICKNAEKDIRRTLQSVATQNYHNVEYIIIDGGSSDRTCEEIDRFKDGINYFVSEPDKGIYHAMNKGLSKASGDFVFFLNAGDILFNSSVLFHINRTINSFNCQDIDIFHGKVIMYYDYSGDGYLWESGPYGRFKGYRGCLPHQSTFYNKKAFEKNGLFDEGFKIAGDYEWLIRGVMKNSLKLKYIDIITAVFYQGGISNRPEFLTDHKNEKKRLITFYYPFPLRIIFSILNRMRKILGL